MHPVAAPWPEYQTLLAVDRTRLFNLGRRLRLAFMIRRTRPLRDVVDLAVTRCPWLCPVMNRHPILFRPLLSRFLDARVGRRAAFSHYAHDLEFVASRLRAALPWFFPTALEATLWSDPVDGYRVSIAMNLAHPQEGLWQLGLDSPTGLRLFSICFSVLPGPCLFVGAVQGGRTTAEADVDRQIRVATRQLEGLRPHFLLFGVLRAVAAAWGVRRMVGVSSRHQLKSGRLREGRAALLFSYDRYFGELGASRRADGNWDVPVVSAARDLAAVPSRKRAMYRRREVLLSRIQDAVVARLAG